MATPGPTEAPDGQGADDIAVKHSSPEELKNALYARCANVQTPDKDFTQEELLAFRIIPNNDVGILLSCTKRLAREGLFKIQTKNNAICWKVVKREQAEKYKKLTPDEALIYSYIESAGRDGIWTKIIRTRTNLHMTVINRALKSLENKSYIKPTKTVKFPSRKTYMLAHLPPSEASTGGPFYTDGALDEEFVHQMASWAERYVIGRSWWHPPKIEEGKKKQQPDGEGGKKKEKKEKTEPVKLSREEAERLRSKELERGDIGRNRSNDMLPMPPGYKFPKLSEITMAINESGLSGVVMKEAEMLQLLNILEWDGKIEKVPGTKAYRAIRDWNDTEIKKGLSEAPCVKCPVFDICEDGGPVNAKSCAYFEDWLNLL